MPRGTTELTPAVVLVHGGFWQPGFDRHLDDDLACDLAQRGSLVWNITHRSAADGWPAPRVSTVAVIDRLSTGLLAERVDRERGAVRAADPSELVPAACRSCSFTAGATTSFRFGMPTIARRPATFDALTVRRRTPAGEPPVRSQQKRSRRW